jgi:hypothetical protein
MAIIIVRCHPRQVFSSQQIQMHLHHTLRSQVLIRSGETSDLRLEFESPLVLQLRAWSTWLSGQGCKLGFWWRCDPWDDKRRLDEGNLVLIVVETGDFGPWWPHDRRWLDCGGTLQFDGKEGHTYTSGRVQSLIAILSCRDDRLDSSYRPPSTSVCIAHDYDCIWQKEDYKRKLLCMWKQNQPT